MILDKCSQAGDVSQDSSKIGSQYYQMEILIYILHYKISIKPRSVIVLKNIYVGEKDKMFYW